MNKKTKRGGTSILEKIPIFKNINKKGIYIADDIDYNIREGKKEDLIQKYRDNLNEAKKEVILAKESKERDEHDIKLENEKEKNIIELKKHRTNQIQFFIICIANVFNFIIKLFLKIGKYALIFLDKIWNILKNLGTGFKNVAGIGQGVIIKTIVLILIIIALFFGINYFLYGDKGITEIGNKLVATDKDYTDCLIKTTTPNFFDNISNSFYGFIPDKYKYQFNFFKNKLNSIVGNDIYELVGTEREKINTGRNDGIYHIKKNDDKNNTYTTLKPRDIEIPMSSIEQISNIDYNKLPTKIKELYPIDNKTYVIPVEKDDNNRWKYDIEKIRYKDDLVPIKKKDNSYVLPFINTSNVNEYKLNKIRTNIYNDNDKSASTIYNKMFNYSGSNYKYPSNL
jgi:hypothetical protein